MTVKSFIKRVDRFSTKIWSEAIRLEKLVEVCEELSIQSEDLLDTEKASSEDLKAQAELEKMLR